MNKPIIALMAVTPILLYCAVPARADTNGYLWEIHAVNAQHGTSDTFMAGLGNAVCLDLADGATIYDIGASITQKGSPFTNFEAGEIIFASADQLCPNQMNNIMRQVGATTKPDGRIA